MACGCNKRNRATPSGVPAPSGTYRVYVNDRKVYESSNQSAAETVGVRFIDASIKTPNESTLVYRNNIWTEA